MVKQRAPFFSRLYRQYQKRLMHLCNDVVTRNQSRKQRRLGLYFGNASVRRRNAQEKKMSSRVIEGLRLAGSVRHRLLGVYHVWLHLCDICNLPPPPKAT